MEDAFRLEGNLPAPSCFYLESTSWRRPDRDAHLHPLASWDMRKVHWCTLGALDEGAVFRFRPSDHPSLLRWINLETCIALCLARWMFLSFLLSFLFGGGSTSGFLVWFRVVRVCFSSLVFFRFCVWWISLGTFRFFFEPSHLAEGVDHVSQVLCSFWIQVFDPQGSGHWISFLFDGPVFAARAFGTQVRRPSVPLGSFVGIDVGVVLDGVAGVLVLARHGIVPIHHDACRYVLFSFMLFSIVCILFVPFAWFGFHHTHHTHQLVLGSYVSTGHARPGVLFSHVWFVPSLPVFLLFGRSVFGSDSSFLLPLRHHATSHPRTAIHHSQSSIPPTELSFPQTHPSRKIHPLAPPILGRGCGCVCSTPTRSQPSTPTGERVGDSERGRERVVPKHFVPSPEQKFNREHFERYRPNSRM